MALACEQPTACQHPACRCRPRREDVRQLTMRPPEPPCAECGGRGEILDAPDRVLDGHAYWTPCPVCRGGQ